MSEEHHIFLRQRQMPWWFQLTAHLYRETHNMSVFSEKRFPEADLVDEIEDKLDLPLSLGNASPIELSEGPFRIVVVVSTLFHISHLDDKYKRSVIRESFLQALRVAQQIEVKVLATAILQGGWRFTSEIAFSEMLKGYASGGAQLPDVHVYCLESTLAERLRDVTHSLGFR
jgi:hypothetical protein